jgi:O-antigen/teichoic acid export membrane protein
MATGLAYLSVPLFLLLCACSPFIMSAYGAAFKSAWPTFCILQGVVLVQILQSPIIKFMESVGHFWLLFVFNAAYGVVMILSAMFLVRFGSAGLASALFVAIAFHSICLSIYAFKRMRKTENVWSLESTQ